MGFFRVVEKTCAEAFVSAVALQYVEVHAAFASSPECGVGGELIECDGSVAKVVVHFHHCRSGGEGENFCIGKHLSRQFKNASLDTCRQSQSAEFIGNDQS